MNVCLQKSFICYYKTVHFLPFVCFLDLSSYIYIYSSFCAWCFRLVYKSFPSILCIAQYGVQHRRREREREKERIQPRLGGNQIHNVYARLIISSCCNALLKLKYIVLILQVVFEDLSLKQSQDTDHIQ